MNHYRKKEDQEVLPLIQLVLEARPTYGYKRVTAMVNRCREEKNLVRINKKRVYRIMKINGLLIPKFENRREKREKTGKVMTLHSNTRWCSDAFEIRCFNGEKVYVAFSLDCKDREIMDHVARTRPLLNRDIQELMIGSVENRFGRLRTPRKIEWLTDRGKIYRANDVKALAQQLGLKPCYTAAYSPESNGMAEAFVGTFKRDYVYNNDCYNAEEVLKKLPEWFDDYNEIAPHSALDMKSPREYKKLQQMGVN